ncbi:motility associated factor glycosyltransferase family protein [Butyrivibrio sp. VCB2006]|uniref:motility associated factor glycosyltransferase family protein n=1 Tax=Butyrivibrio sp. VCB2006 TaxID=1280679 RepID=UPI000402442E|nr:6-hydroxymethylpterin diphosphokinase MptE-like protein [Butyrivibrio sp. VCB2006]
MAVDFLEEIYNEANLIFNFKKMISYCRGGKTDAVLSTWDKQTPTMASFCRRTAEWDNELGNTIWEVILSTSDYIKHLNLSKAADEIEALIPNLYQAMSLRGPIDVTDDPYRLFSSQSGFLCLQDTRSGLQFCSNLDPAYEAYEKANTLCTPMTEVFCTFGCGLGYMAWQIYEVSDHMADIYIYETDAKRVAYAREYGVLDWIPKDKIHVITGSDISQLINAVINTHLSEGQELFTTFYIEHEMLDAIESANSTLAAAIGEKNATTANFLKNVERNFYSNYENTPPLIDAIDKSVLPHEWIVVGAGPSLDYNIDYIKSKKGSSTIIAATTAVKRLLKEDIVPDLTIAIDMQERTYSHLEGVDTSLLTLIISDCANWKFKKFHKGNVYMIPTNGNYFSSLTYKTGNIKCREIRGTVTAVAAEVAAFLGAEKIDLVGLDLAYPGGQTHASGTMDNKAADNSNYILTKSVDGQMVNTTALFESYRHEMEAIIAQNPQVSFYNKSKYGAYIKGCKS